MTDLQWHAVHTKFHEKRSISASYWCSGTDISMRSVPATYR